MFDMEKELQENECNEDETTLIIVVTILLSLVSLTLVFSSSLHIYTWRKAAQISVENKLRAKDSKSA